MKERSSDHRLIRRNAFLVIARVFSAARRVQPVAALCLTVLILGVVCLTASELTHAWGRMSASSIERILNWWPAQSVQAQGTRSSNTPTFTVFDAPGAGTGMLQGTMGTSINNAGDIAGIYLTAPNVAHGFVRSVVNGTPTFATFDAPNAGTALNQGTFPIGINTGGDIAGMYFDANNAYHGFVRAASGTLTEFDVPAAPTNLGHRGTNPLSINTAGAITGFYVDASDVRHGFVRAAGGTFTTFDAPGAGTGLTEGTVPLSINTAGDTTGFYKDATGTFHGFVRAANGTITAPIDAPGAGICCGGKVAFKGTLPLSFDGAGDIGGIYADSSSVNHGFVYTAASGTPTFTTFSVPNAGTSVTFMFPGTLPLSMNAGGDISGFYTDTTGVRHGFLRAATTGIITAPIDAPGAATTGMFSGTILISINTAGDMTGTFADASNVFHGFVLAPTVKSTAGDFDGDGKADSAIWRPSNGTWYVIPSRTPSNFLVRQWGVSTDIPVRGDFDGDGKTDFAVWRPSTGTWYVIPSSNPSAPIVRQWGASGDIPVPGDYDGDGKMDFAVFRPSTGTWYIIPSSNPSAPIVRQWGTQGDIPVPGDYDGDGKTDFAVFRPSTGTWYIIPSSRPSTPIVQQWGTIGDIPVPVDYDGDHKTDIAVWRPSNGTWYVIPSSSPANFTVTQWGTSSDVPVQKPIGQ